MSLKVDKSIYLRAFNIQLIELLEDIERVLPDNLDVLTMNKCILKLKKSNPKLLLTFWYKYIECQYGDKIAQDDFDYFLEKDYKTDCDGVKDESVILDGIERIRGTVKMLDSKNKEISLNYIKNMCQLSKLYSI